MAQSTRTRLPSEDRLDSSRGLTLAAVGWLIAAVRTLFFALLVARGSLAIYYSDLPWSWARLGLAAAFAAFAIWAVWLSRHRHARVAFAALFLGVVAWWITIGPSHDREWRPEVAVMPRVLIGGGRVRIAGVRNFDYRTVDDFTVPYDEREIRLSQLPGI